MSHLPYWYLAQAGTVKYNARNSAAASAKSTVKVSFRLKKANVAWIVAGVNRKEAKETKIGSFH